ncbi:MULTISPECIES: ABC transporter permease [Aerococcus]|uniref:ABC transporter permease n=2 Tax=Aerococcus TaxID=1375 RepID=UPI0015EB4978|nr:MULTISPECIES: iron ABC transporter permease [Aerococcus]MDL5208243.1 iron ABC transporter permease [Aerococcus tenax]WOZ53035.1 iron ABC transporter permease [Aerococcus tenax]
MSLAFSLYERVKIMLKQHSQLFWRLIFSFIALTVFICPLLTIIIKGIETPAGLGFENFALIFDSSRTFQAIKNTLILGLGSTCISFIFGLLVAIIVAYTNIRFKKAFELLTILPFVIPGYIMTLSWTSVFAFNSPMNSLLTQLKLPMVNLYSMGGMIFILGLSNAALVYLNVIDILKKVPIEQEWASRISGYNIVSTLKNINLPSAKYGIANGIILAFLSAIDNFAIVSTLGTPSGIPVLSTYIYEKAIGFGPHSFNEAAVLSIILSLIAFTGVAFRAYMLRKSVAIDTERARSNDRIQLTPKYRRTVEGMMFIILLTLNILPLVTMFFSSLQVGYSRSIFDVSNMALDNYAFILQTPSMYNGFWNSFILTTLAILVCLMLSIFATYYKSRIDSKATSLLELGASITYSTPGIVLALSMILYWSNVPNVYGSLLILFIAYITRYFLVIFNGSSTAITSIPVDLEQSAQISGSKQPQIWRKIILPLMKGQLLSSSFLMFSSALTELTLSSLLAAANTKTIGLTIYNLQTSGDTNTAQAYSVLLTLFILLLLFCRNYFLAKEEKSIDGSNDNYSVK